jgi:hypothetical protein
MAMQDLMLIAAGAALVGVGWFVTLGVKKGWSYAVGKVEAWWNSAANAVKNDVATLKTDVAAIKTKLGM